MQPTRQTWLAVDLHATGKPPFVVIKFLTFGRGVAWDELQLFEREAQVLQQLDHPQIPHYLDSFHLQTPEPWWGLIEEYIPGHNFQTLIHKKHRFSESEIYDVASQVLTILTYLHRQSPPILHRDIKPSNLILNPDHQIFLVDFGAVQNQWASTGSFTVVGTYGYTPLEQFGGQAVPASDLYSLGATLLHLLTGMAPAELAQPDLQLRFHDGHRRVGAYDIPLSRPLAAWLEKMTAPALADRFESARAALLALERCRSHKATVVLSSVAPQRLQIESRPDSIQVRIHPLWTTPLSRLQDLASMTLLTLLGPLALLILSLLPLGAVYTRQAFTTGDVSGISVGLLCLCLGGVSWVTSLNWIKGNLTSTFIEVLDSNLTIQYQLFGWTYWQRIKPITDVASLYSLPLSSEEQTVMLRFHGHSPMPLAYQLRPPDSQVLIETLQYWCDLTR